MTGTEPITTSVEHRYGVAVLAVGGEIDMVTAPQFEKAIDDVLADDPATLVIDLTEVTFLASEGLRLLATANKRFVLATANKRFGESGGFAVIAGAPATIRPIELTDLDEVLICICPWTTRWRPCGPSIACGNYPGNAGA